jgi:sterol desaturase/sphingolipid hydroxylase (fatty acid hydroxylase superfamily)
MVFSIKQHRGVLLLIVLVCVILEMIWSWRRGRNVYNVKDTATNLAIFAGYQIAKIAFAGYQLGFLALFYPYRIQDFGQSAPVFILTFFCVDFSYYWFHRASHTIKFFWAFHMIHHSSQEMNLTVAYRLNWFTVLVSPAFYVPLVLLGLPPVFILGSFALNLLYQFFIHTEAVGRLGVLEYVMDTPSSHRVHHGSNAQYIDKNFGGVLIIWDRLFGTYQAEGEKVRYGITTGFVGYNPLKLVFKGFYDLARDRMNYKG